MEYGNIINCAHDISRIIFGASNFYVETQDKHFEVLDEAYKLGITTYDTAALYTEGQSEIVLGNWISSRGLEDKVVIISKGGHYNAYRKRVTPYDILADIYDSLARLQVNSIGIYLLHRDDIEVPVTTIMDSLNRLYDGGKIGIFGCSNWTHERIESANEYAYKYGLEPMRISSPNFSLCEQLTNPWGEDCVTLSNDQVSQNYYKSNGMPVFAYAVLANGFLSGGFSSDNVEEAPLYMDEFSLEGYICKPNIERLRRCESLASKYQVSVSEIAIAWVLEQSLNTFAIVRTSSPKRLATNLNSVNLKLTQEELKWLNLEI